MATVEPAGLSTPWIRAILEGSRRAVPGRPDDCDNYRYIGIRAVADRLDLTPGSLNGSIQTYLDVLPPDYKARLITLPARGRLHIALLHRQDVMVMKLFAGRPRDLTDMIALRPTPRELQFVRNELPRLRRIDQPRTARLER